MILTAGMEVQIWSGPEGEVRHSHIDDHRVGLGQLDRGLSVSECIPMAEEIVVSTPCCTPTAASKLLKIQFKSSTRHIETAGKSMQLGVLQLLQCPKFSDLM